jgi:uncharacterized protein
MNRKLVLLITVAFLITAASISQAQALRPNYVYDRANVLDSATVNNINAYCSAVDNNSTVEIVVVTLTNLDGYGDINDARVKIFNDEPLDGVKGIGKPDKDNGVLLVMSVEGPHSGIEVGYGLEGNLTDSRCGRILDEVVMPQLKAGNYSQAMLNGVTTIAETVSGTSIDFSTDKGTDWVLIAILIVVAVIVIFGFIAGGEGGGYYGGSSGGGGGGGFGGGGSGGGGAGRFRRKN